jgi:hypothetical protein
MSSKNETGVIYVAFGRPYLAMTLLSASTLRQTNPDIPVCIITNVSEKLPRLDFWDAERDHYIYLNMSTKNNREVKIAVNKYSPFRKTIYLDCDTVVTGDLSYASFFLDYFDIALRPNPKTNFRPGKGEYRVLGGKLIKDLPHWNGGVFMFKKNKNSADFFKLWKKYYDEFAIEHDQISLVEAIFNSKARFLPLDKSWNLTSFYSLKNKNPKTRIIHYTSRISPLLRKKIAQYNQIIPVKSDPGATEKFFRNRTEFIKKKYGCIRYTFLRLRWILFP